MATNKGQEWLQKQTEKFYADLQKHLDKNMKKIDKDYKRLHADIVALIMKYFNQYSSNGEITNPMMLQLRYMEVARQVEARLTQLGREHNEKLNTLLEQYHNETIQFQHDLLTNAERYGVDTSFMRMNIAAVELAMLYPYQRYDFTTSFNGQTQRVGQKINELLVTKFATGQSVANLSRDIEEACNMGSFFAQRIARTEVSRTYTNATLQLYRDSQVEYVRWLDSTENKGRRKRKTCDVCKSHANYNGGIYRIDELPSQPAHPHCRCTIVAHSYNRQSQVLL